MAARLIKFILFLVIIGLIGLLGFAYLGDLRPEQSDLQETVILEAN